MITDKQMIEAAKIIKEHCRDYDPYDHCEGCPFDVSPHYCPLDAVPAEWKIPEVPSDKNELGRNNDEKC